MDKKVYIKDYGETTATGLMKEIEKYPAVVFSKGNDNNYYENWLSDSVTEEWENTTLEAYLESIEAWMTDTNMLSDKPNWKKFAQILLSGRFYE
ncbi:hypothetical protein M3215_07390 [Bacillus cytotoxicus]|uniref:Uncharacterized protein n=1 Tax=Bacillus cytotoxicus TaxID=580165 RepID=A0ACC6A4F6_9BACI|nr:hypothetical protein [Bacillus cytotoxicus]